jgi:DNA-directed RNA polymerase alpha subunit
MDITFRATTYDDLRLIKIQIDKLLINAKNESQKELDTPISEALALPSYMGVRIINALYAANIFTLRDLTQHPRRHFTRAIPNFGDKCLTELETAMRKLNLSFADA